MKNILVPIDFSVYAQSAARAAVAVADKTGAAIHLLNIAAIPVGWQNLSVSEQQNHPLVEAKYVEAKINLDKFSQLPMFKGRTISTHLEGGIAFEQINIFAKKNHADLIVMCVHGSEEAATKFIGSTAQRVVRTAPCPVMSVKKDFSFGAIKKILFASDFDENVVPAINTTLDLAGHLAADVYFGYVHLPGDLVDQKIVESRLEKFGIAQKGITLNTVVHNSNEKEIGIIHCAKEQDAHIIAMVTHLRKQKPGYLLSTTDSVLFHSKVPVISFILDEHRHQMD